MVQNSPEAVGLLTLEANTGKSLRCYGLHSLKAGPKIVQKIGFSFIMGDLILLL